VVTIGGLRKRRRGINDAKLRGQYRRRALLEALFLFVRDVALIAAAASVAWWIFAEQRTRAQRRDEAARVALAAERQATDLRQWADRIEARSALIEGHLAALAAVTRDSRELTKLKLSVHRLLQRTDDPFLTFAEIEREIATNDTPADASATPAGETAAPHAAPGGDMLRRVLIELVRDGVIAQLAGDRYFIASDYETGGEGVDRGPDDDTD
jgi:hypothetical protein